MKMDIQQGRGVGPNAEEKGMAEIHLTGESGQEVPARGQDGKDAGQNDHPYQIRILADQRHPQENDKEKGDDDSTGEDQHLSADDRIRAFSDTIPEGPC